MESGKCKGAWVTAGAFRAGLDGLSCCPSVADDGLSLHLRWSLANTCSRNATRVSSRALSPSGTPADIQAFKTRILHHMDPRLADLDELLVQPLRVLDEQAHATVAGVITGDLG